MAEHYPCKVCTLEAEDDDKSVHKPGNFAETIVSLPHRFRC